MSHALQHALLITLQNDFNLWCQSRRNLQHESWWDFTVFWSIKAVKKKFFSDVNKFRLALLLNRHGVRPFRLTFKVYDFSVPLLYRYVCWKFKTKFTTTLKQSPKLGKLGCVIIIKGNYGGFQNRICRLNRFSRPL